MAYSDACPSVPSIGMGIGTALYKIKTVAAVTNGLANVKYISLSTMSTFLKIFVS